MAFMASFYGFGAFIVHTFGGVGTAWPVLAGFLVGPTFPESSLDILVTCYMKAQHQEHGDIGGRVYRDHQNGESV